jgi:hypothetical protein
MKKNVNDNKFVRKVLRKILSIVNHGPCTFERGERKSPTSKDEYKNALYGVTDRVLYVAVCCCMMICMLRNICCCEGGCWLILFGSHALEFQS